MLNLDKINTRLGVFLQIILEILVEICYNYKIKMKIGAINGFRYSQGTGFGFAKA